MFDWFKKKEPPVKIVPLTESWVRPREEVWLTEKETLEMGGNLAFCAFVKRPGQDVQKKWFTNYIDASSWALEQHYGY